MNDDLLKLLDDMIDDIKNNSHLAHTHSKIYRIQDTEANITRLVKFTKLITKRMIKLEEKVNILKNSEALQ